MRTGPKWAPLLLVACLLAGAGAALAQPAFPPPRRPIGPLTGPSSADPLQVGLDYLRAQRGRIGLAGDDLDELSLRDRYQTRRTGITHLYLRQQLGGIDVFNAGASLATDRDGRLVVFGDRLVRRLRERSAVRQPVLSDADAVARAAAHLGLPPAATLVELARPGGPARAAVFAPSGLSLDEIPVRLEYVPQAAAGKAGLESS